MKTLVIVPAVAAALLALMLDKPACDRQPGQLIPARNVAS